jgi:hypothetical protein
MDDHEVLSDGTIHWIASTVADGTATPEDARRLLVDFVEQVNRGRVTERTLEHLRDCIAAYLGGEKKILPDTNSGRPLVKVVPVPTLEKAFGLDRPFRGPARLTEDVVDIVAHTVLRYRLGGDTFEQARDRAAADHHKSPSRVGECWARGKQAAYETERVSRSMDGESWTEDDVRRLQKIYAEDSWFSPPGKGNQYRS